MESIVELSKAVHLLAKALVSSSVSVMVANNTITATKDAAAISVRTE